MLHKLQLILLERIACMAKQPTYYDFKGSTGKNLTNFINNNSTKHILTIITNKKNLNGYSFHHNYSNKEARVFTFLDSPDELLFKNVSHTVEMFETHEHYPHRGIYIVVNTDIDVTNQLYDKLCKRFSPASYPLTIIRLVSPETVKTIPSKTEKILSVTAIIIAFFLYSTLAGYSFIESLTLVIQGIIEVLKYILMGITVVFVGLVSLSPLILFQTIQQAKFKQVKYVTFGIIFLTLLAPLTTTLVCEMIANLFTLDSKTIFDNISFETVHNYLFFSIVFTIGQLIGSALFTYTDIDDYRHYR